MMLFRGFIAIAVALLVASSCSQHSTTDASSRVVLERYITAFNAHDEASLRSIVSPEAQYYGANAAGGRPLIEQNLQSWSHPMTADSKVGLGQVDGKDVLIVWTKPHLEGGGTDPWTKGAYFTVTVRADKISRVDGVTVLGDPELQKRITGTPPT
jgi:hypothetical protein